MKRSCFTIIIAILISAFCINKGWSEEKKQQVENEICLECHSKIFDWKTKRKDILELHTRHVKSKRTEYGGMNKKCVTCHEAWALTDEPGWTDSPVYHPDTAMRPAGFWKKHIQKKDITPGLFYTGAAHHEKPYYLKPLLDRLVCLDCHGTDSKVKVLYGTKAGL